MSERDPDYISPKLRELFKEEIPEFERIRDSSLRKFRVTYAVKVLLDEADGQA